MQTSKPKPLPGPYHEVISFRADMAVLTTTLHGPDQGLGPVPLEDEIMRMEKITPERLATFWLFRASRLMFDALEQIDKMTSGPNRHRQLSIIEVREIRRLLDIALAEAHGTRPEGRRNP